MIKLLVKLFGSLKRARQVWKYSRWILLVVGVIVTAWTAWSAHVRIVEREKTARIHAQMAAETAQVQEATRCAVYEMALKHKDEQLAEARRSGKEKDKQINKLKLYDPTTGNLIAELDRSIESERSFEDWMKELDRKTPKIELPPAVIPVIASPAAECIQERPLGVSAFMTTKARIGAEADWLLLPRVDLPLFPDFTVRLAGGAVIRPELEYTARVRFGLLK